eukprot:CAMPEP_0198332238 /NCGR_PEP_ID=MMETSP1450-20131203/18139_1 /TAXON_ID=753684 ORGANISM="Madagascaria erythrocladiodes, Strain CCMP3234" /NCGR_SAMPLE_ID=MMETSP1450 /ASSEMBLY_ACC=CAM_ASM_001115 /LENGTH=100 /DNA_ID=CAMNT_0044036679 /DNA_START=301 /DNA_END=603 /DNA_ORIENTATION=+
MSKPSGGSTILHTSPVTTSPSLQTADAPRSSGGKKALNPILLTYLGRQGQLHSPAGPSGPSGPVGPARPMGPSGPGGPGGPSGPVSPGGPGGPSEPPSAN